MRAKETGFRSARVALRHDLRRVWPQAFSKPRAVPLMSITGRAVAGILGGRHRPAAVAGQVDGKQSPARAKPRRTMLSIGTAYRETFVPCAR